MNQQERQRYRDRKTGKYERTIHCEGCDKALSEYFSDPRVDTELAGRGLVLCLKCANKIKRMTAAQASFWLGQMEGNRRLKAERNARKH